MSDHERHLVTEFERAVREMAAAEADDPRAPDAGGRIERARAAAADAAGAIGDALRAAQSAAATARRYFAALDAEHEQASRRAALAMVRAMSHDEDEVDALVVSGETAHDALVAAARDRRDAERELRAFADGAPAREGERA